MYHRELAEIGVYTKDVLFVDTSSGESIIVVQADSISKIHQAQSYLEKFAVGVSSISDLSKLSLPDRTVHDAILSLPDSARSYYNHQSTVTNDKYLDVLVHSFLVPAYFVEIPIGESEEVLLSKSSQHGIYINHWDTQIAGNKRWSIFLLMGNNHKLFAQIAKENGIKCTRAWRSDVIWNPMFDSLFSKAMKRFISKGFSSHDIEDVVQHELENLFNNIEQWDNAADETDVNRFIRQFFFRVEMRLLELYRKGARQDDILMKAAGTDIWRMSLEIETSSGHRKGMDDMSRSRNRENPTEDFAFMAQARKVIREEIAIWRSNLKPDALDRINRLLNNASYDNIATTRGEPVGTTKSSVKRALEKLNNRIYRRTGFSVPPKLLSKALQETSLFQQYLKP